MGKEELSHQVEAKLTAVLDGGLYPGMVGLTAGGGKLVHLTRWPPTLLFERGREVAVLFQTGQQQQQAISEVRNTATESANGDDEDTDVVDLAQYSNRR